MGLSEKVATRVHNGVTHAAAVSMPLYPADLRAYSTACSTCPGCDFHVPKLITGMYAPVLSFTELAGVDMVENKELWRTLSMAARRVLGSLINQ